MGGGGANNLPLKTAQRLLKTPLSLFFPNESPCLQKEKESALNSTQECEP